MNLLPSLDACLARVGSLQDRKERTRVIAEYLAGNFDPSTPEGKQLGQRRALLVTKLRTQKLWNG